MKSPDLTALIAEVRPADTVPFSMLNHSEVPDVPLIVFGSGIAAIEAFERLASKLAYGSAVVMFDVIVPPDGVIDHVEGVARKNDFRLWNTGSKPPNSRLWVKSAWTGDTNGTHRPYLFEAIRLADSAVLELGSGPSSTPHLHHLCATLRLPLVTLESSEEWFAQVKKFESKHHHLEYVSNIVESSYLRQQWGVVFVDHAPGETRGEVLDIARDKADYLVCHDSEELGYRLEPVLSSFRYRKDFRKERPWTTVVSERRDVW